MATDFGENNEFNDFCPLMAVAVSHSPPARDNSPSDYFPDEFLKFTPFKISVAEISIPTMHEEISAAPNVLTPFKDIQPATTVTPTVTLPSKGAAMVVDDMAYSSFERHSDAEGIIDAIVNEACKHAEATSTPIGLVDAMNSPRESHAIQQEPLSLPATLHQQPTDTATSWSLTQDHSPPLSLSTVPTFSLSTTSSAPSSTGSMSEQSLNPSAYLSGLTSPTALSVCSSVDGTRRRGFMRPQATSFADSARNRDSVMALGTIAHLQYYFARTGLLDGRGGQIARAKRVQNGLEVSHPDLSQGISRSVSIGSADSEAPGLLLRADSAPVYAVSDAGIVDSPLADDDGMSSRWGTEVEPLDPTMLQPTVSTYHSRLPVAAPAPDLTMLRRELTEALEDALKVLKEAETCSDDSSGFHEIQGLHLLDIATLAIRAAKVYYTAHPNPASLYALKSERQIRAELFDVLELLQKMAARNFAGGIRQNEKVGLLTWIVEISELVHQEMEAEKKEERRRKDWVWRGNEEVWTGRERERAWLFLRSFADYADDLPSWGTSPVATSSEPPAFLRYLATGIPLIQLHNTLVKTSSRPFEQITHVHTDINKPYRRSENLRYWLKAAERRWDLKLDLDVVNLSRVATSPAPAMGVEKLNESDMGIWDRFGDVVLKWCTAIRKELEREWDDAARAKEAAVARKKSRISEGSDDGGTQSAATATEVW